MLNSVSPSVWENSFASCMLGKYSLRCLPSARVVSTEILPTMSLSSSTVPIAMSFPRSMMATLSQSVSASSM